MEKVYQLEKSSAIIGQISRISKKKRLWLWCQWIVEGYGLPKASGSHSQCDFAHIFTKD